MPAGVSETLDTPAEEAPDAPDTDRDREREPRGDAGHRRLSASGSPSATSSPPTSRASSPSESAGPCPTPTGSNTRAPATAPPPPLVARRRRRNQRDRHGEAGGAAQGRDAATRLNGVAGLAGAIAQRGDARVEVGCDEGEPPEEGGPLGAPPARSIASGGSWTTSRIGAPTRKNAWRGAPAGVGSSRTRRRSRPAASSAPTVRSRSGVIATTWSRPATPLGCAGGSPGGGRSERVVARPSSSVASRSRSDHPTRPLPASLPARRIRVSPTTHTSPSTSNPHARQAAGASATVSSSRVDGTRASPPA